MTPPPMTTARARAGTSVIMLYFFEQPVERSRGERRSGPLVPLHAPCMEVEVERTGRVLDRAPQRPAVLRDDRLQPRTRDRRTPRGAEVRGDELLELVWRQVAFGADVAELEAGVVVAGVLVVDQPQLLAVVDEVARQQVVVAGHERLWSRGERGFDLREPVGELLVARRQSEAVLPHDRQVSPLPGEHVELVDERGPAVQPPARFGHAADDAVALKRRIVVREAIDVTDDQYAHLGVVRVHGRSDTGPLRCTRVEVLGVTVYPEQTRIAAAAARDERTVGCAHLEIAVGEPTGKLVDRTWAYGEQRDRVECLDRGIACLDHLRTLAHSAFKV